MQRATISLVVVIIEGTANVHFLLPMVVTTCTAKFVGNFFGYPKLPRREAGPPNHHDDKLDSD